MKVLVARPIIPGGTGYCYVPEGELVMFSDSSSALMGIGDHGLTTAVKVVERDITEEELAKLFTQSFLKYIGTGSEKEISEEFGLDQAKSLSKIAEQYPVGTRLYIKSGLKFNVLKEFSSGSVV